MVNHKQHRPQFPFDFRIWGQTVKDLFFTSTEKAPFLEDSVLILFKYKYYFIPKQSIVSIALLRNFLFWTYKIRVVVFRGYFHSLFPSRHTSFSEAFWKDFRPVCIFLVYKMGGNKDKNKVINIQQTTSKWKEARTRKCLSLADIN